MNLENYVFLVNKKNAKSNTFTNDHIPRELIDQLKQYLSDRHRELIMDSFGDERKKNQLKKVIQTYISRKETLDAFPTITELYTLDQMAFQLTEEIAGLGVIQPLITPTTTDVYINNYNDIWVNDIFDGKYRTNVAFSSFEEFLGLCNRFVNASKENWSMEKPFANPEFPHMRVHLTGYDVADHKANCTIRIISKDLRLSDRSMLEQDYADGKMIDFLQTIVKARQSFLITGETGAGKTELLRYLIGYFNPQHRLGLIEDTRESFIEELYPHLNSFSWKTRIHEGEAGRSLTYSRLIQEALREDPEWLLIQESRGAEAEEMLAAGESGHAMGTTFHAKSAKHAVERLTTMAQKGVMHSETFYYKRIAEVFRIGIHLEKINNKRKIKEIVEYQGYDKYNQEVIVQPLFRYNRRTKQFEVVGEMSEDLAASLEEAQAELEKMLPSTVGTA